MGRFVTALALAALAVPVAAGEAADPPRPAAAARSMARMHPVIGRLGLGDEQIGKIDVLLVNMQKKLMEAVKELRKDGKAADPAKLQDKQKELQAEYSRKIREVVPAGLQEKFDAGNKIMEDGAAKQLSLQSEMAAAFKEAGGDKEKLLAARKSIVEKARALALEINKELDEKVGKMPEPTKVGN